MRQREELEADGVRHVVLDPRGLMFMDLEGLRELVKQTSTPGHRHNLAVVRGTDAINRLLKLADLKKSSSSSTTPRTSYLHPHPRTPHRR